MNTAYINRSNTVRDDIDTLTQVPFVEVKASSLKPGMVLLDPELVVPAAEVDHRIGTRGGTIEFMLHDYDRRSIITERITANATVKVMAR